MSMILDELSKFGVNIKTTLERFSGNEDLYKKCLILLVEDENFEGLGKSLKEKNYDQAFICAHTLKGIVGNMGFEKLYELICNIVEPLRAKDFSNLDEKYKAVMDEYKKIVQLNKIINE